MPTHHAPTPDEVMVYLKVLERFETPAYASAWRFFRQLSAQCPDYETFKIQCPLWSEPYAQFDLVMCSYETAAILLKHQALNEDLVFEQLPRVIDVWQTSEPWVRGLRHDYRAGLFASVEQMAVRMEQWEREQAEREAHATVDNLAGPGKPEPNPPPMGVIDEIDAVGLKFAVLKAAMELDVFTTIARGYHSLEEIAAALQCSVRGMRVQLDALCPLGLLHKSGGTYVLTPTSQAYLVRGMPTCCIDIYLAWFQSRERFADCVRSGKPTIDLTAPVAEDLWVSYVAPYLILWPELAEGARTRWDAVGVNAESMAGARILDVACGSGVKSFVLAQADPNAHVTVIDSPKVLEVTASIAEAMGVAAQVTYQSGDVLEMDLGTEQFDLVFLGNILHYFPPDHMQAILRHVHSSLGPRGLVVIDDGVLDEERCLAEDVLLAAVEMVNSAPYAEFHTFSEYKELLESVGFTQITLHGTRPVSARKNGEVAR